MYFDAPLPEILLASASPRRKELLKKCTGRHPFRIVPSHAEELAPAPDNTFYLALANAERKAHDVAVQNPECLTIGADTLIEFEERALGKPEDPDDAVSMLLRLSGKTHCVTTGVCILSPKYGIAVRFAEHSFVTFKPFVRATAEQYTHLVSVLDKAGAYAIQEHGEMIVEKYTGSFDNIVGLPTERLTSTLNNLFGLFR